MLGARPDDIDQPADVLHHSQFSLLISMCAGLEYGMRLSFRVSISRTSSLFYGLPFVATTGIMRNAASLPFGSQRAVAKGRPVMPILRAGLVESNLTPPRSPVVGVPHIFGVAKGWHVGYPPSTDLTTGRKSAHRKDCRAHLYAVQGGLPSIHGA
jgi:hypothetical protein